MHLSLCDSAMGTALEQRECCSAPTWVEHRVEMSSEDIRQTSGHLGGGWTPGSRAPDCRSHRGEPDGSGLGKAGGTRDRALPWKAGRPSKGLSQGKALGEETGGQSGEGEEVCMPGVSGLILSDVLPSWCCHPGATAPPTVS